LGVFLLSWIGIAGLVFLASLATEIVQLINNHKATALPVVVVSIVLLLAGSAFIVVMRRVTYWRWKQLEVWLTQLLMK
jgi:Kef-type K+ transport system membrane component KefB